MNIYIYIYTFILCTTHKCTGIRITRTLTLPVQFFGSCSCGLESAVISTIISKPPVSLGNTTLLNAFKAPLATETSGKAIGMDRT